MERLVKLPPDTIIRVFSFDQPFPETLAGVGQWIRKIADDAVEVTCLVNLRCVVSLFHLQVAVFRSYRAYQSNKLKGPSFLSDICYQLGGNKNIPHSIKTFSTSPSTTRVAAVKIILRDANIHCPAILASVESADAVLQLSYDAICEQLRSVGVEAPVSEFEFIEEAAVAEIVKLFKLSSWETTSRPQLEGMVLTHVALKDCS